MTRMDFRSFCRVKIVRKCNLNMINEISQSISELKIPRKSYLRWISRYFSFRKNSRIRSYYDFYSNWPFKAVNSRPENSRNSLYPWKTRLGFMVHDSWINGFKTNMDKSLDFGISTDIIRFAIKNESEIEKSSYSARNSLINLLTAWVICTGLV